MSEKTVQTAGRNQLGEFAPMFAHLAFEIPGEDGKPSGMDLYPMRITTN